MPRKLNFYIDGEFSRLLPPPSPDEIDMLERSLLQSGKADFPLLVWHDGKHRLLIDGHRRLEILERHSLPYKVEERQFNHRGEVIDWILSSHLCKRNISPENRMMLYGLQFGGTVAIGDDKIKNQLEKTGQYRVRKKTNEGLQKRVSLPSAVQQGLPTPEILADYEHIKSMAVEAFEKKSKENMVLAKANRQKVEQSDLQESLPLPGNAIPSNNKEVAKRSIEGLARLVKMLDQLKLTEKYHRALELLLEDLRKAMSK